jgi:spectinomycin phosphotransferase
MNDDPGLDSQRIAAVLASEYGVAATTVTFLPLGHDPYAAVYEVAAGDGTPYFLKVRFGPVFEPGLAVPRALIERGVPNILAPMYTRSGALWCSLGSGNDTVVLYPYIRGHNAADVGLNAEQWRAFSASLRAVHDSGVEASFRDQLRTEDFTIPSTALVRQMQTVADTTQFESPAATAFAAFWREHATRIDEILARAEDLGRTMQAKSFQTGLCHSDIHTANILVSDDGQIHLIDWDSPLIAPRERDLLFVIGSQIARTVEPEEEAAFFAGYGPVTIDQEALIYYRYERIIEDLGEFGKSVFVNPRFSEEVREEEAALGMGFFEDGELGRVEMVDLGRVPRVTGVGVAG